MRKTNDYLKDSSSWAQKQTQKQVLLISLDC